MPSDNLADISAFESLQSEQHIKTGMSSMSIVNAFEVVVSDLVKRDYYEKVNFKYPTKEAAEKIMKGWHSAEVRRRRIHGMVHYYVCANGQIFSFSKEDAEKVVEQSKQVKVIEVD
jgi:hypothetical protein